MGIDNPTPIPDEAVKLPTAERERLKQLSFEYSIESELRGLELLKSINPDFFRESGYKIVLPKGITLEMLQDLSDKDLRDMVETEFDPEGIKLVQEELQQTYDANFPAILALLESIADNLPSEFHIAFTQYGAGGSYGDPGWVRLSTKAGISVLYNFLHELVHSIIEVPIIKKNDLSHWEKESIVDYILNETPEINDLFPNNWYQKGKPSEELLKKAGLK